MMRWLHRIYAAVFGYFWLPCPICGRCFGGHEHTGAALMTSWFEGRGVCSNCETEAARRNKEYMDRNPPPTIYV